MISLQSAIKPQTKICRCIKIYILSLFLTITKKNCASMSRSTKFSYSSISKSLDCIFTKEKDLQSYFMAMIHRYSTTKNPGVLISDSSQLMKLYAKK